jgi:type I restriction enzyme S subunit
MEVKPGYKQTELGIIPEEWHVCSVAQVINGFRNGFAFKSDGYVSSGIPIVTMAQVGLDGKFNFSEDIINHWPESKAALLSDFQLFKGDVIIAMTDVTPQKNLIGRMTEVTEIGPLLLNQRVGLIRVNYEKVNSCFLRAFSNSPSWRSYARAVASLGVQANIGTKDILAGKLPLPPLPEQRVIAAALSDVDELLGGLDRLIAKKRDLKQAAMQQLLTGQTRLPGFTGEWEVKSLSECLLGRPQYGINASAVPYSDRLPAYIRITDITEHGHFRPNPRVSVSSPNVQNYFLSDGDIVFARTGASVGKSYRYDKRDGDLVFAGFLIRVRPNPNLLNSTFLTAFASTTTYWNWVRLMSMRSGQPGINGNEYAQLLLKTPPVLEQTAIAEVLSDIDAEITALEQRREKTKALKQAMMQELLTGRIRLV